MGQIWSFCCPCLSSDYTAIKDLDENTHHGLDAQRELSPTTSCSNAPSSSTPSSIPTPLIPNLVTPQPTTTPLIDFDLNSTVFKGCVVQQKFFNKSTYEAKFAWINLKSKALCLSEHMTKERKHKEASIADVTGVICGPPEKYKAAVNNIGEPLALDPNLCLSVKFVRGGGIDLKFSSMRERDDWADVVLRLINSMQRTDNNNGRL
jgi:hypothetical protein